MRLLRTSSPWTIHEFFGERVPSYAILSHRWEDEEVTFQDMQKYEQSSIDDDMAQESIFRMRGWTKILSCCRQAVSDGFEWVWIDTCCIDKSSSAELSEAINSMFAWYRNAKVCYAYLSDVPADELQTDLAKPNSHFSRSKWFTRGWTLQELLAPLTLKFFNQQWRFIGDKEEMHILISKITGIDHLDYFEAASVAQKMFWASRRETTRIEDLAYSLLGIFGINMPPMYGEGEYAFERLQLEILKTSDDESIFAWIDSQDQSGGLLARSVSAFQDSQHYYSTGLDLEKPPYTMTNKGLQMETHLLKTQDPESLIKHLFRCSLLPLQCSPPIAIYLRQIKGSQYARIAPGTFEILDWKQKAKFAKWVRENSPRTKILVKQRKPQELYFYGPNVVNVPSMISFKNRFMLTEYYLSDSESSHWEKYRARVIFNKTGQTEIGAAFRYRCFETFEELVLHITIARGGFHAIYDTIMEEESLEFSWKVAMLRYMMSDNMLTDVKVVPVGREMETSEHLNRVELPLDEPGYHMSTIWKGPGTCFWDVGFVTSVEMGGQEIQQN